jgi:MSHA biogenesis protein MshG
LAHFAYKARDAEGALVEGVLESVDSGGAATHLFDLGITPVDILPAPAPPAAAPSAAPRGSFFDPKITVVDLMLFSRQMYALLKAGVPMMRALAGLQDSTVNKAFGEAIQDLREGLDAGRELSTSLKRHPKLFSPFYINMVAIGEMTGRLEEIFLRLSQHLEFEKFMSEQVKAAIRYPIFVVSVMAAAIIIINIFVIPAFDKVYKSMHAKLPLMTQILIDFSSFMLAWWPLLLFGVFGALFGFRYWSRTSLGKLAWDGFKLKIPVAGKIVLKATLARFSRSFALASRSGVPIVPALTTVAQTVDNDFIAAKIRHMREGVERGESLLRTASAARVFTPVVLQMIAVGEESGALDDLMQEIADMYQREVEFELKTLSSQIEPILIIFLGGLVLILALGVFLPIWDLGANLMKQQ